MKMSLVAIAAAIWLVTSLATFADLPAQDYSDVEKKHPELKAMKDPKTGFIVGGKNSSELVRGLTEINGISIPDLEKSMRPQGLSTAGFLGKDESLLDVMAADNDWVLGAGLTHQELARHLYTFYRISRVAGERRKESEVFTYRGIRYTTYVQVTDGFQHSPFKDGTKTSADVYVKNVDNGKALSFSPLVPLMVERYGFYEGHGTSYRVDPKDIVDVFTFLKVRKNESHAEGGLRFARGAHLLHMTFDEKDPRWSFNHDVNVRTKGEELTLIVLEDVKKKEQKAGKAGSKQTEGGLGNPSEDDAVKSPERPSGQKPLLSAKRKLHGIVDTKGDIRFGITAVHDGKLVSLHFVGRSTLGGASGKVYFMTVKEPVREGAWRLWNPFSRPGASPGYNGMSPLGR